MRPENVQAAITALYAYGEAARNDGFPIDVKTLQLDMREIAAALKSDTPITAEKLISYLGLAKTNHGYEWEIA